MDFGDCPCGGKSLAKLVQPATLAVLARQPLHGYLVCQHLQEMAMFKEHPPDPAGIYRALKALEKGAYVASSWDLSESGPARRRYELTDAGRACLERWVQTLQEYSKAMNELLKVAKKGVG